MPGIFICYRRDDASTYAGRLYEHLSARFGAERVFIDVDTIKPGDDFVQVLEDKVGSCDALIAIIGYPDMSKLCSKRRPPLSRAALRLREIHSSHRA